MEKLGKIFDEAVDMMTRPVRFCVVAMWCLLTIIVIKQLIISIMTAYNSWSIINASIAMIMVLLLAGLILFAVFWATHWAEKHKQIMLQRSYEPLSFLPSGDR